MAIFEKERIKEYDDYLSVLTRHGYAKYIRPFVDILIIQVQPQANSKARDEDKKDWFAIKPANDDIFATLSRLAESLTLPCCQLSDTTFGIGFQAKDASQRQVIMSGYGLIEDKVFDSSMDCNNLSLEELASGTGTFEAFILEDDEVFACNDYFGMGRLFIYSWNGGALVTNRAHLAAAVIRLARLPLKLNEDYMRTLVLEQHVFSISGFNEESPIKNLTKLPIRHLARISEGGAYCKHHIFPKKVANEECYQDLLLRAKSSLVTSMRKFIEYFKNNGYEIVCDVTGGKDSRILLSLMLDIGEKFNVRTIDQEDDLLYSNMICSRYRLKYIDSEPDFYAKINAAYYFDIMNSYTMGNNNTQSLPGSTQGFGQNGRVIFTGGGGEIYREQWSTHFHCLSGESVADNVVRLMDKNSAMIDKYLSSDEIEKLRFYLIDSFSKFDEISPRYEHYLHNQLRSHFGITGNLAFVNSFLHHQILSKDLQEAYLALSVEDRENGRCIYDFIFNIDQSLADLPYTGGFPYADSRRQNSIPDKPDPQDEMVNAKLEEWNTCRKRKLAKASLPVKAVGEAISDPRRYLHILFCKATCRLLASFPSLKGILEQVANVVNLYLYSVPSNRLISRCYHTIGCENFLFPLNSEKYEICDDDVKKYLTPIRNFTFNVRKSSIEVSMVLFDDCNRDDYVYKFHAYSNHNKKAISSVVTAEFPNCLLSDVEAAPDMTIVGTCIHKKNKRRFWGVSEKIN